MALTKQNLRAFMNRDWQRGQSVSVSYVADAIRTGGAPVAIQYLDQLQRLEGQYGQVDETTAVARRQSSFQANVALAQTIARIDQRAIQRLIAIYRRRV